MEEKIQVLIENYNLESNSYELGKQYIKYFSLLELKSLLQKIPVYKSKKVLPIQIVTEKFILRKLSSNLFFYEDNYKPILFQTPINLDLNKFENHVFKIDEIEEIFQITKRIKKKSKILQFINNDYSMFILPLANIILIFILLFSGITDIPIIIVLIWLIIFSSYCAIYNLFSLIKIKKYPQKIKIEYSLPLIDKIEKIDFSEIIVYAGQLALFGFLVMHFLQFSLNFNIALIIVILIIVFFYFCLIVLFFIDYFTTNKLKKFLLKIISNETQKSQDFDTKRYYLQLGIAIEKRSIITAGSFPKLTSILLFLISMIPIISYFYP
ncbi:MAG: hypothetical protein ACFFAH_05565 [Promethearchaeota archaeon]